MKHTIPMFTSTFFLHLSLLAAIPLEWEVDATRSDYATFFEWQGAEYDLKASFMRNGRPIQIDLPDDVYPRLYWQTNGMDYLYWEAPASFAQIQTEDGTQSVLRARWKPEYETGNTVYNGFVGITGTTYNAAFQLRLRRSPGAHPNDLPLPQPVIDFARVKILNPPWPPGGVDTNAVRDIVREEMATNGIRRVDGAARMLPKYLWSKDFYDSYPEAAEMYYKWRQGGVAVPATQCSAVRSGGLLYRNFDFPLDDRAEFIVRMSAGHSRLASVGVAQVDTNLTEEIVTSGKPSVWYKALPGATVDGINERGVVAEINVVDGPSGWPTNGAINCFGAVRWVLDNATNAEHAATTLAANVYVPPGLGNYHWMIADERETWIVENGTASNVTAVAAKRVMTNFPILPDTYAGMGKERYDLLFGGANITNAWYTRAYLRTTNWISEFKDAAEMEAAKSAWETHNREQLRGHGLWQTVHTSVYDISKRVLRVAVQETDDWYTFQIPASGGGGGGGVSPQAVREIVDPLIEAATNGTRVAAAEDAERMITQRDAADFGTAPIPFSVVGRIMNKDVKLVVTNGYMSIMDLSNTVYTTKRIEDKAQAASEKVDRLEALVVGSNVVFSVTNNASGKIDLSVGKLKIKELLGDPGSDSWHEVYDSREEIVAHQTNYDAKVVQPGFTALSRRVTATSNWVENAKAPLGWGAVASDGLPAPTNTVVIRAPSTVFAGGHAFERVNVGTGTVGILVNRGAATYTGEPGTFRFRDAMTGEYFGYVKNTYTLGVHTDGIEVDTTTHMVTLTYNVTMSSYPIIKHLPDLDDYDPAEWEPLNDISGDPIPGASHSIAWEDPDPEPGKKVCHIDCTDGLGFFTAEIAGIDGDCRFETNMAAEFGGGIVARDTSDTNVVFAVEIVVEDGQPKLRIKP